MDLGLLLKKVKAREYKDKKAFSDDLNLIWDNCFEYNTWPEHPLRRNAGILRNKGNHLLQFVHDVPQKPAFPTVPSATPRASSMRASSIFPPSETPAQGRASATASPAPHAARDGRSSTPARSLTRKDSAQQQQQQQQDQDVLDLSTLTEEQREQKGFFGELDLSVALDGSVKSNRALPPLSDVMHRLPSHDRQNGALESLLPGESDALDTSQISPFEPTAAPADGSLTACLFSNINTMSLVRSLNAQTMQSHPTLRAQLGSENMSFELRDEDSAFPMVHAPPAMYSTTQATAAADADMSFVLSALLAHTGFEGKVLARTFVECTCSPF